MQRSWRNSRTCKDLLKTASDSDTDTDTELQNEQLPTYHPLSYVAKKHNSQLKSAENAIHIIPFLLLLCALVLCFFSIPESRI